jgi:signal transduction histidine kinase
MMSVNTPLVGDVQSADQGESLTYLTANAIENLLHNRDLTQADTVVNFAQTILVAVICGLMWEFGSLAESVITAILWFTLIYAHSLLFSWFNVVIPLADTFLASALISIFAAVNKLKSELKEIAERQTSAESKTEIARLQSHFLDEFAGWLKIMTELVITKIQASKPAVIATAPDSGALFHRAFAAGEDFHEYLESIRQIPSLENAAGGRLQREKLSLEPFIERITRRFTVKLGDRNMRIHLSIARDAQTVRVNASLLDSIIFNYISNAVKYSPKDSTITIRVRRTKRRRTVISVMDEGVGIAPELRERIFEKFYRIQDDRLYGAKGTGLGLYLCRYFAEQMGGKVEVRSGDQGIGSEFRVVLP